MKHMCARTGLLVAWLAMTMPSSATAADEEFLASLSRLVTRVAREEVREKKLDFDVGPLKGQLQVIEPDESLAIDVKRFELANDWVDTTVTASGLLRVTGQANDQAEIYAIADVKVTITAEARFTSEGEQVFIEPLIKDIDLRLSIRELLPIELSGSEELISNLAVALFNQNKTKILAEANRRIGKRPL